MEYDNGTLKQPLEIDPAREELILFSDVKTLGIRGITPSYNTIYRYATKGVKNRSGAVVYLRYVATPTGYATSQEALYQFIRDLNE